MGTTVLPSVKDSTETSGPVQKFLNHHPAAAVAEDLVLHHDSHGLPRPPAGSRQMMTPLPRARPSALTTMGTGRGFDVGKGRVHIVEDLISGGGNAVFFHQIFGKDLAALDDWPRLSWGRSRECPLPSARPPAPAPGGRPAPPRRNRSAISPANATMAGNIRGADIRRKPRPAAMPPLPGRA